MAKKRKLKRSQTPKWYKKSKKELKKLLKNVTLRNAAREYLRKKGVKGAKLKSAMLELEKEGWFSRKRKHKRSK